MLIKNFFRGSNGILACVSFTLLFIGLLSCLVISGYWFSYYYPYGKHAEYTALATYYCTLLCLIFSLIGLVILIFILISYFIPQISENTIISGISVTFFTIFSILSIIAGLLCGVLGSFVINPNGLYEYEYGDPDYLKNYDAKCYPLLFYSFSNDLFDYVDEKNDIKGYAKWIVKIGKKISKDIKKFIKEVEEKTKYKMEDIVAEALDLCRMNNSCSVSTLVDYYFYYTNPSYNDSLCKEVGIPSFVFSIITLIGIVLFAVSCCCSGKNEDANPLSTSLIDKTIN